MTKVRVYEVARDLGIDNKALVLLFQSVGVSDVRNHMSAIGPEAVERVKRHLEKQKAQKGVEEHIRPTVVKRRAVVHAEPEPAPSKRPSPEAAPPRKRIAAPAEPVASEPASAPVPPREKPDRAVAPHAPEPIAPVLSGTSETIPEIPAAPVSVTEPVRMVETKAAEPPPEAPSPTPQPVERGSEQPVRPSSPPKTGIDVWEGRPGVPMPQAARGAPTPRRVQYDAKAGAAAAARRGTGAVSSRIGTRAMRHRGIGTLARQKGGGQPVTQERSAHKKVVRIQESIGLPGLAGKIGVKATEVLMKLISLGMSGVNINSTLDADTAKIVANEFGWEVEDVAVSEADAIVAARGLQGEEIVEEGLPRPPVVTVMGHVDHGKTSLLDQIRKTSVVTGEAGGITQHIGAYTVESPRGTITFLDTPGHEAFTAMRARGAQVTDIVVLVVAADDGVMPQTKEAVNHARAANVQIVVAINKMDKADAQPDRVRRELADLGLIPEEWGGEVLYSEVSAMTRQGIDRLLEQIALQAELLDLRAKPDKPATGVVLEAELDRGKGPVANVLITDGTLHRGDVLLAGSAFGKVRAMQDSAGRTLSSAGPSVPASIVGLNDVPNAGDPVHVIRDLKKAQEIAESRKQKDKRAGGTGADAQRMSLEDLAKAMAESEQLELRVIVKADVQGSVEAVSDAISRLGSSKVKVAVVHAAAGAITEGDVNLAVASGAIIVGFNVRPAGKATALSQKEHIEIRQYDIIYNVVDDIKAAMEGLLAPTLVEKSIGRAEVRQLFKISKAGTVAGCMVINGAIRRTANARLLRDNVVVWQGKLASLKRFKDDAREVKDGLECGISLENFNDVKEGDVIEAYEVEQVKQTL